MELNLAPQTLPAVEGNFDAYKADLIKQIEGYKSSPLTEETVAPVKSAIRSLRTTLEKIESTAVSAYFDSPKKALKAQFAELYSIIAEGESKVDAIIAEDTRKRNEETTARLINYIKNKAAVLVLEPDVVDYVILEKSYYNKTAKEAETLDAIDKQLVQLKKNYDAYLRAEKKIEKLAKSIGPVFNKARYLYALSKYGEGNDSTASLAEEEAERISSAVPATPEPERQAGPSSGASRPEIEIRTLSVDFPVVDKKKSKGSDDLAYMFSVPKEAKKNFTELLRELKDLGITSKKL